MDKNCQIPMDTFFCGKVLERMGIKFPVPLAVCESCTPEKIDEMCEEIRRMRSQLQPQPYKDINLLDMAENFFRAMGRAAEGMFKKVKKEVYVERQVCCTICSAFGRCAYCGCRLGSEYADKLLKNFSKTILASEEGCPNPDTYPNLKKFPPRNYWAVCDEMTSVIIPSRNEKYLNRTIQNLLKTATGKIEVIVVLDGMEIYEKVIKHEKVRVICFRKPRGWRAAINEAAKSARGKYLLIIDAHCKISPGWDTKLKCVCDDRTVAVTMTSPLDKKTWEYDLSRLWSFCSISPKLTVEWWLNYRPKSRHPLVKESMAFMGGTWMITKQYYDLLGGLDENFSEVFHGGAEMTFKIQLHSKYPGEIMIRKDVICGHVTRKTWDNYKPKGVGYERAAEMFKELWGDKIHDLVKRFAPVPGWDVRRGFKEGL